MEPFGARALTDTGWRVRLLSLYQADLEKRNEKRQLTTARADPKMVKLEQNPDYLARPPVAIWCSCLVAALGTLSRHRRRQ